MSVDGYGHSASHGALTGLDLDDHRQYVQHYASLTRRNMNGGGTITWDGSTLTTTDRLIWIPGGAGGSGHISLPKSGTGGVSISVGAGWNIVYVRLTDEQMSATGGVDLTSTDVIVQDYKNYNPNRNDLVIGVRNGDPGDHRFYMDDGRVIAQWRIVGASGEPAFQNGWVNYGSIHSPASFRMNADQQVELRGLVKNGTLGSTVFRLPAGYRPGTGNYHHTISLADSAPVGIRIYENGDVVVGTPGSSNAWVALHNIVFNPRA